MKSISKEVPKEAQQESPELADWLSRLEALHPSEIELGLQRVAEVAARMGLDQLASNPLIKIVTIAGTNGKGSCVATLEALAKRQGVSVGAYTSPHLLHYCERIRIDGLPVADKLVCDAFAAIDHARDEISLTYFEFGTLAALEVFRRQGVELLLLEVGLGGRLDAVNIIDSDIAVVTSIDIDHEDWLGSDREVIGAEKAGVFRCGKPAICSELNPPASIARVAQKTGANLMSKADCWDWQVKDGGWSWQGRDADGKALQLSDLPVPGLPLPSVAAALQVAGLLGWTLDHTVLTELIAGLSLAGRAQTLMIEGCDVLLDVAHNPAAAELLARRLQQQPVTGKTRAVLAVMADKDIDGLLSPLWSEIDEWFACGLPGNSRAALAASLAQDLGRLQTVNAQQRSVSVCDTVAAGLKSALAQTGDNDRVLVVGSFFTVAEALRTLS